MELNRGSVVWAQFDPVKKGEQGRRRPCVIVSYDALNHSHHPGVIVCPITGRENVHRDYPTHVVLPPETAGMQKESIIMAEQIRLISRTRLDPTKAAARLPPHILQSLERALQKVLDLP